MKDGSRQDEVRIPVTFAADCGPAGRGGRRELAGSAGVTPAYVGLEPTLILPIDPPRSAIVHRREVVPGEGSERP